MRFWSLSDLILCCLGDWRESVEDPRLLLSTLIVLVDALELEEDDDEVGEICLDPLALWCLISILLFSLCVVPIGLASAVLCLCASCRVLSVPSLRVLGGSSGLDILAGFGDLDRPRWLVE